MPYTKTPASGYRNIKIKPNNSFFVQVGKRYLGTFSSLTKAFDVRDEDRRTHGMKKLNDRPTTA